MRPRRGAAPRAVVRAAGVLLAALLALVVAGCVVIPRSGGVQAGGPIEVVEDESFVFNPARPQPGATQEQIVRGFLGAAINPQDGFAIAREYLAPALAARWNPVASVLVDSGPREVPADGSSATITAVADVDARGRYQTGGGTASVTLDFELEQVDGEWRISEADDGIVVAEAFFDVVFTQHSLYFIDPSFRYLVPDVRWFPARSAASTRIVSELLAGPSEWLVGAVTTAFPEGSALVANSVPVEEGVARVDLTAQAAPTDEAIRVAMQRQLEASLTSVTGVSSVELLIEQAPLAPVPPEAEGPTRYPAVASAPYLVRDGAFGTLVGDVVQEIPGLSAAVIGAEPRAVTILGNQSAAALLTEEGALLVSQSGASILTDARPGLVPPSLDRYGWMWSVPESAPTEVRASDGAGEVVPLTASWADAAAIRSLTVSRDGTRLAALVQRPSGATLLVGGIGRSADGTPVSLTPADEIALTPGTGVVLDWVDESRLAQVVRDGAGEDHVQVVRVGGRAQTPFADPGTVASLAGVDRATQVRVLTEDGTLLSLRSPNWQVTADGASLLARVG